jgi:hypothetical protein
MKPCSGVHLAAYTATLVVDILRKFNTEPLPIFFKHSAVLL